jgi:hypothetical protein
MVGYFYEAAGYSVKDACLKAIKSGNYAIWPGLTLDTTTRYCPSSDATIKEHMVQIRHNVCSTRRCPWPSKAVDIRNQFQDAGCKIKTVALDDNSKPSQPSNVGHHLHVETVHRSKLHTENIGHFLTRTRNCNKYVVVAYHSSNVLRVQLFTFRKDVHSLVAYSIVMQKLNDNGLL